MLAQIAIMLGKITLMVSLTMALRWTLPRFRFDQLMRLAWEGMIPTALLILTCTAVFVYFGIVQWMWVGSLLCLSIIWFVGPRRPKSASPNAKIGMIGSRFSPLTDEAGTLSGRPSVALDDRAIPDPRQGMISQH